MSTTEILQTIILAVSAWTLKELVNLKTKVAKIEQRFEDLGGGKHHPDPEPTPTPQNGRFRP